jgi:hypothetical protein
MTSLIKLIQVVMLSLILIFTVYTYESQQALARDTAFMIMQSRQYADNRIIDSQTKVLDMVGEVSKATRLLAIIICQRENDRSLCSGNLNTQGESRQ